MTSEQATIYRKMSIPDRLRVAFGLHEFARKHLEATLRADHPEYSERQLSDAIVRRFLGDPGDVLRGGAEGPGA